MRADPFKYCWTEKLLNQSLDWTSAAPEPVLEADISGLVSVVHLRCFIKGKPWNKSFFQWSLTG